MHVKRRETRRDELTNRQNWSHQMRKIGKRDGDGESEGREPNKRTSGRIGGKTD